MIPSSFFTSKGVYLVADASAVINLNASLYAVDILTALPHPVVVTDQAWGELELGAHRGYDDADRLNELKKIGLVVRVSMGDEGNRVFEQLVIGTTVRSLDDGEAATIGYAHEVRGIALIDEHKARRLCMEAHPTVELISTAELLLHPALADSIGVVRQTAAIVNALRGAKMNVPKHLLKQVIGLIGNEAASSCPSLPRLARERSK